MALPTSDLKSSDDWADLHLPVPERPLPLLPSLPLATVYALNDELVARTSFDDEYFALSLASKSRDRFVL